MRLHHMCESLELLDCFQFVKSRDFKCHFLVSVKLKRTKPHLLESLRKHLTLFTKIYVQEKFESIKQSCQITLFTAIVAYDVLFEDFVSFVWLSHKNNYN
jgi:hypothetical protein